MRLLSLDTYRGLIMCLLAVNGFALAKTAAKLGFGPKDDVDSTVGWIWQTLAFHNSHPMWNSQFYIFGCSLWDLIQPSFMFMVGVSMPYSYANRRNRGHSNFNLWTHALVRALVLVAFGVFLQTQRNWFDTNRLLTNVLAQIGLGYFFVYLLLQFSAKIQVATGIIVLVGYTAWLAISPVPDPMPEKAIESIQSLWVPSSVAKHYALGTNAAAVADESILNLIPHDKPIKAHAAGYTTLNFVPSAITILLGVLAGSLLRSDLSSSVKLRHLWLSGFVCMLVAVVASFTVCPIVKKIWTPSWVLFSGAYVLWILAALYWVIDVKQFRVWTFPFVVVGMNSLAMYLMGMLMKKWVSDRLTNYLGRDIFDGSYGPMIQAVCVFAVLWLICLYLYRNKLFLRI